MLKANDYEGKFINFKVSKTRKETINTNKSYFKGSSKRTEAAEWKTIETSLIIFCRSEGFNPNPSRLRSPSSAIKVDDNLIGSQAAKISFPLNSSSRC